MRGEREEGGKRKKYSKKERERERAREGERRTEFNLLRKEQILLTIEDQSCSERDSERKSKNEKNV